MSEDKVPYNTPGPAKRERKPTPSSSIAELVQAVEVVQWGRVTAHLQAGRIVLIEVTETKKLT